LILFVGYIKKFDTMVVQEREKERERERVIGGRRPFIDLKFIAKQFKTSRPSVDEEDEKDERTKRTSQK
jgi:hypothetical protein